MRVWDISPGNLCNRHLLGEHAELHAVWSIITQGKKGYSKHPETKRWRGKLKALFLRHEKLVDELKKRGCGHKSNLNKNLAKGKSNQEKLVDSVKNQIEILKKKHCCCKV